MAQLQKLHLAARRDGRGTSFLPGRHGGSMAMATSYNWFVMGLYILYHWLLLISMGFTGEFYGYKKDSSSYNWL